LLQQLILHFADNYPLSAPIHSHTTMSQPQLKVTYFPVTGRAEITRLALAFGGIEYEDHRVQRAEYAAIKPTLPLNQIPVLEVDGVVYAQSMAMARYAGRLSGLYPTDAIEALKVDMLIETLLEGLNAYIDIMFQTKDETVKAEKTKTFVEQSLPNFFGLLEKNVEGTYFPWREGKPR
jgi:prostaglandin-H2 D-isomerase / glutathione transferase